MSDKELQFLNFYISSGKRAEKKVQCYRMAFKDDCEGLKDSTVETYAKRLLASSEAKGYLEERQSANSSGSLQLLESLRYLDIMLADEKTPVKGKIDILREKRQTISELEKNIHVVKTVSSVDEQYAFSDKQMSVRVPNRLGHSSFTKDQALELLQIAKSSRAFISVDHDGTMKLIKPLIAKKSGDLEILQEGIQTGSYQIAVQRIP